MIDELRPLSDSHLILKAAKLDNLVLLPASQLPFKDDWQQLANELPLGSTLIVLPEQESAQRRVLKTVAHRLEAQGRSVRTTTTRDLRQV